MRYDPRRPDAIDLFTSLRLRGRHDIPAAPLRAQFGANVEFLLQHGALVAGRPLTGITCPACDEDHSVEIEHEAATGRSSCFCPIAGRVFVDESKIETLRIQTNWLALRVASVLEVDPSLPFRELMPGSVWWLGDRNVGSTKVSFALSVGLRGEAMEALTAALKKRKAVDLGILLSSGGVMPSVIAETAGYHPIDLSEVLRLDENSFSLDQARLGAWVRELLRRPKRPAASKGGRPSARAGVLSIFNKRQRQELPYKSKSSEARAIIEAWSNDYPDTHAPGFSTIRAHLPDLPH